MIGYLRRLTIRNLCSPYGIAVVPYCVFLFAWVFPPNLYSYYVHEPDLMFLNPAALLFYTACVSGFLIGVRAILQFTPGVSPTEAPAIQLRSNSPLLYLTVPLIVAAVPCFILMLLIGSGLNFVSLILTQQGDVMKMANNGGGGSALWGSGLFLLTGCLWWAGYRAIQLQLGRTKRRIFLFVYVVCLGVDILTCLASFDRTNLMPLLTGCIIVYLFLKTRRANVKLTRLAAIGFGSTFVIFASFLGLQFARGASRLDAFITSMLGYTIVSYNRMAAMIGGAMHYPFEGKGAYVVAFLLENGRLSDLRDRMGLPTSYGLWLSEFPSLRASGLNLSYNWSSVFGYLFSDLGWWTPVYMFAAGLIAGYLWSRFRAGSTFGIACYPWIAFWILFWFGWNLLFDARGVVLMETGILLTIYDKLLLRRVRLVKKVSTAPVSAWVPIRPANTHRLGGGF